MDSSVGLLVIYACINGFEGAWYGFEGETPSSKIVCKIHCTNGNSEWVCLLSSDKNVASGGVTEVARNAAFGFLKNIPRALKTICSFDSEICG